MRAIGDMAMQGIEWYLGLGDRLYELLHKPAKSREKISIKQVRDALEYWQGNCTTPLAEWLHAKYEIRPRADGWWK